MSESDKKKDGDATELQKQLDALKEKHEALLQTVAQFPFKADGKRKTVNLLTEDGKPNPKAQRMLAGGAHFSQRKAESKAVTRTAQVLTETEVDAILDSNPELQERWEDGDKSVMADILAAHNAKQPAERTEQPENDADRPLTRGELQAMLMLERLKQDPAFLRAAKIVGVGDVNEGAAAILGRYNRKVESGDMDDGYSVADVVRDVFDTAGVKMDRSDASPGEQKPDASQPETPGQTDGQGSAEQAQPGGEAGEGQSAPVTPSGAAGSAGTPKPGDTPDFDKMTDEQINEWAKQTRAETRPPGEFDQRSFLP